MYLLVLSSEQAQSQVSSENADFGHRLRLSGEIPPGWRPLRPLSGGGGGGGGGYSVAPLKATTGTQDGYCLSPFYPNTDSHNAPGCGVKLVNSWFPQSSARRR